MSPMALSKEQLAKINSVIQAQLKRVGLDTCTPIMASRWLEAKGLLPIDQTRPGRPLRILLRKGLIRGARQEDRGSRWVIRRVSV
jgi:hypothetical protein